MNILVVGGAGYVGSVLVPMLVEKHSVTVYDNLAQGIMPDYRAIFVYGDIRHQELFAEACKGKTAIIYLAGLTNNDECMKDLLLADDINRDAFVFNIKSAKAAGVKHFIYASSVALYGEDNATEQTKPNPTTLYAHAKQFCEGWAMAYNQPDFIVTITRSASVYGASPCMRCDLMVNKMIEDAKETGAIQVNGGDQKRSHVHIHDLCEFYELLLDAPVWDVAGQVFNVVAENQMVKETARHVANAVGSRIVINPYTDDRSYSVSGEKAERILNYRPKRLMQMELMRENRAG